MQPNIQKKYEPEIEDLLTDPVLLAVLKRDGLTVDDIRQVIESYRQTAQPALN